MTRARDTAGIIGFQKLTLDASNNIGIGSTIPRSKLNVSGIVSATSFTGDLTGTATNANNINITATTSTDTTTSLVLVSNQATGNQFPFIDDGLTYNANTNTLTATTFSGSLSGNATSATTSTTASGLTGTPNITVGVVTATSAIVGTNVVINSDGLSITGVVTATDFNSTSDVNLKYNIETVTDALNVVDALRGVKFNWKENNLPSYGVIAQELEQVLPELVSNTDPKTVNYNGIIGVLIEAIKELKQEVEELKQSK